MGRPGVSEWLRGDLTETVSILVLHPPPSPLPHTTGQVETPGCSPSVLHLLATISRSAHSDSGAGRGEFGCVRCPGPGSHTAQREDAAVQERAKDDAGQDGLRGGEN